MNQIWLNKANNDKCILFFNGWGMDERAVNHLLPLDYDVCMFNDFNPLARVDMRNMNYQNYYLVAWSLGVWAASKVINEPIIPFDKRIALNGTLKPIDIDKGIQPLVFFKTYETWNEENREKFNRRMFGGNKYFEEQKHHLSTRDIENQKEELAFLQDEISLRPYRYMDFDCAYIGNKDMIFTAQNQHNFWDGKTRVVESESAHYPFSKFKTWSEILKL